MGRGWGEQILVYKISKVHLRSQKIWSITRSANVKRSSEIYVILNGIAHSYWFGIMKRCGFIPIFLLSFPILYLLLNALPPPIDPDKIHNTRRIFFAILSVEIYAPTLRQQLLRWLNDSEWKGDKVVSV